MRACIVAVALWALGMGCGADTAASGGADGGAPGGGGAGGEADAAFAGDAARDGSPDDAGSEGGSEGDVPDGSTLLVGPGGDGEILVKKLDKGTFLLPAASDEGAPYVIMKPKMLGRLFRS